MNLLRAQPLRLRILAKVALSLFSKGFARGQLGEYERFMLLGGDEIIWSLRPSARVLVLGGYTGASTIRYAETAERVLSLEPVESFRDQMLKRAQGLENVECFDFAASKADGKLLLSLGSDGTSSVRSVGSEVLEVESRDIGPFVTKQGPFELLECNIEGGEYEVLPRLIETGSILDVKKLLVQFHDIGPESDLMRVRIAHSLSKTHTRVWSFDWVWELWEIR